MKKLFLTVSCITAFYFANAQSCDPYYMFTYDDAGNRIARMYIQPCQRIAKDVPEKYTQKTGTYSINVYPNPTRGQLAVAIENFEQGDNASLMVFDTKGTLLLKKSFNGEQTNMDITNQPTGQYVLRVQTQKGVKEWVVEKIN